jgi:integrase
MATTKKPNATPPRRPQGSGGVYERTTYRLDPHTGKRIPRIFWQATKEIPPSLRREAGRARITGNGRTPEEARERLDLNYQKLLTGDRTRHGRIAGPSLTVKGLFELWDEDNRRGRVSEDIAAKYEGYFRNHILPHIGARSLAKLNKSDLDHLFQDILPRKPKSDKDSRPLLGGSALRNIFMALSGCLAFGVRNNKLAYSPLDAVTPPKRTKVREPAAKYAEMASELLAGLAAESDPNYCRWLFQFLGLRRAERLGITWSAIEGLDEKETRLSVHQQLARHQDGSGWYLKEGTKNHQVREVVVPELWVKALRKHRANQNKWKKDADWHPRPEFADLVFLQSNGALITPNRDNEEWHDVLKAHGLPYWRGHINRYITAIWLAEDKDPDIRVARSILGHESDAMAYYYNHDISRSQGPAMNRYGLSVAKRIGK